MYAMFWFFKCWSFLDFEGYSLQKDNTNSELYISLILLLSHTSLILIFIPKHHQVQFFFLTE